MSDKGRTASAVFWTGRDGSVTVVNSATADFSTSSNVAEDAKGAAAVIEPRPSIVSEINGAGGTGGAGRCCGTAGGDCELSADFTSVEAPLDCVTLLIEDRDSPDRGRFGTELEVVAEFEVGEVLIETGGESRYEGAGGGDDVTGRAICGV